MSLSFHALWTLCALSSVVVCAAAARRLRDLAALAVGFMAGLMYVTRIGLPDPGWTGAIAAAAAAIFLFFPRYAVLGAGLGGSVPGVWTALLTVQGLPLMVAVGLAAGLCALTVWLTRTRAHFASGVVLDEGLLAIGLAGIGTAMLPQVLDGWQAASALTASSARPAVDVMPMWTTVFVLACVSLGAAYSVWSRR